jgi:hypothetical protein
MSASSPKQLGPIPIVFSSMSEFVEKVGSVRNRNAVDTFFFSSENTISCLEAVVRKSVDGNTFRAFRFRSAGINDLKPSMLYRSWTATWLQQNLASIQKIDSREVWQELVIKGARELRDHWIEATRKQHDIQFGRAIKLLNLSVKFLLRLETLPLTRRKEMLHWLDVPLDSYTLQGIRVVAPELDIPPNASMGWVRDESQYLRIQEKIRELCQPDLWPVHYEVAAWNLAHR